MSIADMERVALGGESLRMDEGAVIELGDLSDDLGLNLLMNPGKMSSQQSQGGGGQRTFTMPQSQNEYPPRPQPQQNPQVSFGGGNLGGIEVTPLGEMRTRLAAMKSGELAGSVNSIWVLGLVAISTEPPL